MFIRLIADVDDLRLRAPAGMVTAVPDDFGQELVGAGQAHELTRAEFFEGLGEPMKGTHVDPDRD